MNKKSKIKSPRTLIQVLQNGLPAAVFAALHIVFPSSIFAAGFVASLVESLADTAASGIGALSDRVYDITRFKPTRAGVSGGVSLLGTLASLAFALALSALGYLLNMLSFTAMLLCAAIAFLGMLFDSVLGSLLQAKYRCPICHTVTDSSVCCGVKADKCSGTSLVTNGTVNLLCSIFASVLLCLILLVIN